MVTMSKVNISLMENGSPLEGCTMNNLTSRAMAKLRIQGLLPTQLILYTTTMTTPFIQCFEIWIILMNLVRLAELPLIVLTLYLMALATFLESLRLRIFVLFFEMG